MKKKADAAALELRIELAIDNLHALADDITRAVDALPFWVSASTSEALISHARRAKAIAASLAIEQPKPDREMVRLLLQGKARLALVVGLATTTLLVGAGEKAGADVFEMLKERSTAILEHETVDQEALLGFNEQISTGDVEPDAGMPGDFGPFLRVVMAEARVTPRELSATSRIGTMRIRSYTNGQSRPTPEAMNHLARALTHDHHVAVGEVNRLRNLWRSSNLPVDLPDN